MTHTRFAIPDDAAALVTLRASMFAAMGQDTSGEWRAAAQRWFETHPVGDEVLVAVVDARGVGPVSSALAVIEHRPSSPTNPAGLAAHLSQVSTLPEHRRRGYGRACVAALLVELDERGVRRTDLSATDDGDALSPHPHGLHTASRRAGTGGRGPRGLGFRTSPYPALRRP